MLKHVKIHQYQCMYIRLMAHQGGPHGPQWGARGGPWGGPWEICSLGVGSKKGNSCGKFAPLGSMGRDAMATRPQLLDVLHLKAFEETVEEVAKTPNLESDSLINSTVELTRSKI